MSSVSSFEGSDRDSLFHKSFSDGQPRHSYLRKTDLLDTLDSNRSRDTDAWSVAATIDDQESVISSQGALHLSQRTIDKEMDEMVKDNLSDIHQNGLLRDLVEQDAAIPHHLREEDDDKRSRSNAAEFGDDGPRSATGDFHSIASDEERTHNVVDDQITAPPQPQPSFALSKSFDELVEENDMLQAQLREMQENQKHQEELIMNLRHIPLSNAEPIVNKHTLTQKLTRLQEMIGWFVKTVVDEEWSLGLEQNIYILIAESFLSTIPFGTEKHLILNTAYADQMSRFQTTLGTNLSRWYRKQTIQSLLLNSATKEYLDAVKIDVTNKMEALLSTMPKKPADSSSVWQTILDLAANLSLELHQGNNDVRMQPIEIGSKFDDATMVAVSRVDQQDKVTMIISPLFVDEEQTILLRAKVVLG